MTIHPSTNGHAVLPPRHWLRACTEHDRAQLEVLAAADDHSVVMPTHVFEKRGALVGYASFGNIPLVLTWFDRRHCQPRDSVYYINQLELLMSNALPAGHHGVCCVPFGKTFEPHLATLGYQSGGALNLGFKKFK